MTRINCIPPSDLVDAHLLAEYRELPRVFKLARKLASPPHTYRLGKGHLKFFYNKGQFLWERWLSIRLEMYERGFSPSGKFFRYVEHLADKVRMNHPELWKDWNPPPTAKRINRRRIYERLHK